MERHKSILVPRRVSSVCFAVLLARVPHQAHRATHMPGDRRRPILGPGRGALAFHWPTSTQ